MPVSAIPEGFHTVTPGLTCKNAAAAIELYKKAFGATEIMRMPSPDGRIMHAELKIGDSHLFLADEYAGMSAAPTPGAAPSQSLYLYVKDVDSAYQKAVDAGCTGAMPVADMFWGDRFGKLADPFGHEWAMATHKEDLSPEEIHKRGQAAMAAMCPEQS